MCVVWYNVCCIVCLQGLQKKHEAFESDFQVHKERCSEIRKEGQTLITDGNHNADSIGQRIAGMEEKLQELDGAAARRKASLNDNSAFLQFMWKTDVVDSWIADKETQVRSEDYGRDLSSVQTFLAKQETFSAGLSAFEKEGIQTITTLKDQLVSSRHEQTPAIEARYNAVMARWQKLLADAEDRKQKLLHLQDKYRQIEDLYLTFAKKASAFNSWFENAEEDLTDPVRCNSVEEIKALREAHEQFKASLSAAKADFKGLESLDAQIKSFKVGPNPYTWFTMEALEETWNNLQKIIRERDNDLDKEEHRQEENDLLRKQFAQAANAFHSWLTQTRAAMMEGSGSLEEQLEATKRKAAEVRSQKGHLKKIEDLGAAMEERLILDNRYTEHSTVGLAQQWDQLDQLCMRMQHNLEQQIEARNRSGVSEDALREFSMMFKHFDKDKSGKLDHQEFKSCLRALGYDLPMVEEGQTDPEFQAILDVVDPNRDGFVSLQEYMAFMISRETENVQSSSEVEQAFQALTSGEKQYITANELYQVSGKNNTSQYINIHHSTSRYITVYRGTSLYINVHHSTSLYITVHHCTSQYINVHHGTSQYINLSKWLPAERKRKKSQILNNLGPMNLSLVALNRDLTSVVEDYFIFRDIDSDIEGSESEGEEPSQPLSRRVQSSCLRSLRCGASQSAE
ncbi:spectrin alpha chain [Aplysia californica]|uniref:Spectrin alpha chain n=1 Tax=Aplysia californica TaxID=6500 RepID=A0ABM1W317_APLCA|nr:spectrin alpha chain [Aplysia californica]